MTFLSICALHIVIFIICCLFISSKWKFYAKEEVLFSKIELLRQYNRLSMVWPVDNKFFSLKASAFRHTIIPLIFSAIIWFVNIRLLSTILLSLALLYCLSILPRHNVRKRDYEFAGENSQELLKPVKAACFSIIVCAFANYIILFLSYGFRP